MKIISNSRFALAAAALVCATSWSLSMPVAQANPFVFTIDSSRSSLKFSLNNETSPAVSYTTPQFAGSDTTTLSGTQTVDITGRSLTFLSTQNVQFADQPSPVAPAIDGTYPGTAPGKYGLLAAIPGVISGPGPGNTALLSVQNFLGDVTSDPISLSGASFDASQVDLTAVNFVVGLNARILNEFVSPEVGTLDLSGGTDRNELTGGSLTLSGGVYTLTLPIFLESPLDFAHTTVIETYVGQIVATAPVPEPATWILTALGGAALIARRRLYTSKAQTA